MTIPICGISSHDGSRVEETASLCLGDEASMVSLAPPRARDLAPFGFLPRPATPITSSAAPEPSPVDDAGLRSASAAGGVEGIVRELRSHPKDAAVQGWVCSVLMHIASPPQDRVRVAKAGGIELIVAALNAHPENVTVRKNGALALFTFVNDEDGLGCGSEEMLGD